MRRLADLARQRIVTWMAANRPKITQETVAKAVGVSQSWVSQYKSGDVDADVDQLDVMAHVFGHTLIELLDLRPDPNERDLLDAYRSVEASQRKLAIDVVWGLSGGRPRAPERKRNG